MKAREATASLAFLLFQARKENRKTSKTAFTGPVFTISLIQSDTTFLKPSCILEKVFDKKFFAKGRQKFTML